MNPAEAAHGPGLIGTFLNVLLLGVMIAQVFYYFTTYKKDRTWIKVYVLFLLLADILNAIFDMMWVYGDLVTNYGDLTKLAVSDWRLQMDPIMVCIIATAVQMFFAWRVRVLTGNLWITSVIVITGIVSLLGGIGVGIALTYVRNYVDFHKFNQVGTIWLISTAVCDLLIACTLTWHLRRHRTGFQHTDDVLNKIIRLTVQNGAITAVWAVVDLILFLSIDTGIHLAFNLPLAKLYTNSLMSSLNSRSGWKFSSGESDDTGRTPSAKGASGNRSAAMPEFVTLSTHGAMSRPEPDVSQVMIHVESHEMTDIEADQDTKWSTRSSGREDAAYKAGTVV